MGQGLKIVGGLGFKGRGRPEVQLAPLGSVEALGKGGRDQDVYKGKDPATFTAHRLDQLRPFRVLERLYERFLRLTAGYGKRANLEYAAQHRGQLQRLLCLDRQALHPRLDGHAHGMGNAKLGHAGPVPAAVPVRQLAALHQGLANLFYEEGVALSFPVDAVQELGGDLFREQETQHLLRLLAVQTWQPEPGRQPLATEVQHRLVQGPPFVRPHVTVGSHDHHPTVAGVASQVSQQQECAAVGPVDVLQDQQ